MEQTQDPSGASDVQASGGVETETQTDQVPSGNDELIKLSTHRKLLGEKKAAQAKLDAAQTELNTLREEKLMSEGKKDELIQKYQTDLKELEGKYKGTVGNFAYNAISGKVREVSARSGCIDVDGLINLVDLSSIDCDDSFNVDGKQVEALVDEFKKGRPHFFSREAPNIKDGVLKKPDAPSTYEEDLRACKTQKELEAVMKKHGRI